MKRGMECENGRKRNEKKKASKNDRGKGKYAHKFH